MQETEATMIDVAPGQQVRRRRVAQPVDVVVPGRVLLDVEVGLRDVRLGLVVVVVRDEVLDRVVREELAELVAELGGERLVVRDHERRPADLLDDPRHRRGLAGAGRAEQRLVALARASRPSESVSIAVGWSPVGGTSADVLSAAHDRHRVPAMAPHDPAPPYGAYAAIMATFAPASAARRARAGARTATRASTTRSTSSRSRVATFKAARTIARDEVDELHPRAVRRGRRARGEASSRSQTGDLRQASASSSRARAASARGSPPASPRRRSLAPRFGRLLTWSLGAAGANDFLQAGFSALAHKANALAKQGSKRHGT